MSNAKIRNQVAKGSTRFCSAVRISADPLACFEEQRKSRPQLTILEQLAKEHPAQAEVVKLRYFIGMTNEETAEAFGVSVATVKNYRTFARTWIFNEIKNS